MHALLLIAHGSRHEASNAEVRELATRLEQIAGDSFDCVVEAFGSLSQHRDGTRSIYINDSEGNSIELLNTAKSARIPVKR